MPATPTSHLRPNWDTSDLDRKFRKHGREVAELLSIPHVQYQKANYATDSKSTVQASDLHFEAEVWDGPLLIHRLSWYFFDGRLLLAITDVGATHFVTYYPKRCGLTMHEWLNKQPGDRLLDARKWLETNEHGKKYQRVARKHGFD